ncbi:hypothetical protein [uncultured Mucilaginibacter sp.]|nr:hypothetical protein [uncultured Mucilaginibacter sp.]
MSLAKAIVASPQPSPKEKEKKSFPFKVLSFGEDLGEASNISILNLLK